MLGIIKKNLVSKKLWIAVLSAGLLALNGDVNQALIVVLAYLGVQGAVDLKK